MIEPASAVVSRNRDGSSTGKAIVVGDLSLDSVANTVMGRIFETLERGSDATVAGSVQMLVGGTAYLFSSALQGITDLEPVILASVGNDLPGRSICAALQREGLTTRGIVEAAAPTATYSTTYFDEGQRFMICATGHASGRYDATEARRIAEDLTDDAVRLLWISGYGLVDHQDPDRRLASIAYLCEWARCRAVPIVVDLVPHAFHERVGTVEDVVAWLGHVDVFVVELDTALGLVGRRELVGSTDPAVAVMAARALGGGRSSVLVQYRSGSDTYRQTVVRSDSRSGKAVETADHPICDGRLRGIGDRLAVLGLCDLDLIERARSPSIHEEA